MVTTDQTKAAPGMFNGGCACGAVRFELDRQPNLQLYCHCENCLRVSGGPIRESVVWRDAVGSLAEDSELGGSALRITKGKALVQKYQHTPGTSRCFCQNCGNPVYINGRNNVIAIPPINIDDFVFQPTLHVYCADAKRGSLAAYINDGIPKYKNLPAEWGGSGELIDMA